MKDGCLTYLDAHGDEQIFYEPDPALHQPEFHASNVQNVLALGTRGTGKSLEMRADAYLRCLMIPNFHALVVRRTSRQLRESHLVWAPFEMQQLTGQAHNFVANPVAIARFPNHSDIVFGHCQTDADMSFLGGQYGAVYFDELSQFTLEQFLMISAVARAPVDAPYRAVVRAGSNPLGLGSDWMYSWFVNKDVKIEDFPDYNPDDYQMIFSRLEDNKHLDLASYTARLKNLPEHVRRAWLLGERVIEGAYFTEFAKTKQVNGETRPWHVIHTLPTWRFKGEDCEALDLSWMHVVRSIDWGYFPDPAVCHWHLMLPNKRKITFKERTWTRTLAADVAKQIKRESEGMHVVESFCDPTMFIKTGNAPYSIGEIFEQNGVPLVACQNNRELYGYAIHEMLSTIVKDEQGRDVPSWQIYGPACPELVRTIPLLQMDKTDTRKLADGPDHWVVSCAYFAMGRSAPSRDPVVALIPYWMLPARKQRISGRV